MARLQVLGVLGAEPAEVDDAPHARVLRRDREVDGGLAVLGREVAARTHRVDEVVRDVDARERLRQALAREHVALACISLARAAAAECAHVLAAFEQFVDKL